MKKGRPDPIVEWEIWSTEHVFAIEGKRCNMSKIEKLEILHGMGDNRKLNKRKQLMFIWSDEINL